VAADDAEVEGLLRAASSTDIVAADLGTPQVGVSTEMERLVELGTAAVPSLVELARTGDARTAAHAVHALGRIGGASAVDAIREICERYAGREGDWERSVRGACNVALAELGARGG
jgi:HEAT repeat protein